MHEEGVSGNVPRLINKLKSCDIMADSDKLKIYKVNSLPVTLEANAVYFVPSASSSEYVEMHVTDKDGSSKRHIVTVDDIADFEKTTNKVDELTEKSSDTYPSTKAVMDALEGFSGGGGDTSVEEWNPYNLQLTDIEFYHEEGTIWENGELSFAELEPIQLISNASLNQMLGPAENISISVVDINTIIRAEVPSQTNNNNIYRFIPDFKALSLNLITENVVWTNYNQNKGFTISLTLVEYDGNPNFATLSYESLGQLITNAPAVSITLNDMSYKNMGSIDGALTIKDSNNTSFSFYDTLNLSISNNALNYGNNLQELDIVFSGDKKILCFMYIALPRHESTEPYEISLSPLPPKAYIQSEYPDNGEFKVNINTGNAICTLTENKNPQNYNTVISFSSAVGLVYVTGGNQYMIDQSLYAEDDIMHCKIDSEGLKLYNYVDQAFVVIIEEKTNYINFIHKNLLMQAPIDSPLVLDIIEWNKLQQQNGILPVGASDGKKYKITHDGLFNDIPLKVNDYISLHNNLSDVIITRLPQEAITLPFVYDKNALLDAAGDNPVSANKILEYLNDSYKREIAQGIAVYSNNTLTAVNNYGVEVNVSQNPGNIIEKAYHGLYATIPTQLEINSIFEIAHVVSNPNAYLSANSAYVFRNVSNVYLYSMYQAGTTIRNNTSVITILIDYGYSYISWPSQFVWFNNTPPELDSNSYILITCTYMYNSSTGSLINNKILCTYSKFLKA